METDEAPRRSPDVDDLTRWGLNAYGLQIESDFRLPGTEPVAHDRRSRPALRITQDDAAAVPKPEGEARFLRHLYAYNGVAYAMLEGPDGDALFLYGPHVRLHLSADHRELRCVVGRPEDFGWQRVLLDTVLWSVSLLRGFELLHASAVQTRHGVLALIAPTGGGKSSLAAEFLRRGAALFADDIVALAQASGGEVIAYPGPQLMNVPSAVDPDGLPGAVPLHRFGDETWMNLRSGPTDAQPLSCAVLVDRFPDAGLECVTIEATTLTLLPHMRFLPDRHDRPRRRFMLSSALAADTRVLRLTADPSVPPAQLADRLEQTLEHR